MLLWESLSGLLIPMFLYWWFRDDLAALFQSRRLVAHPVLVALPPIKYPGSREDELSASVSDQTEQQLELHRQWCYQDSSYRQLCQCIVWMKEASYDCRTHGYNYSFVQLGGLDRILVESRVFRGRTSLTSNSPYPSKSGRLPNMVAETLDGLRRQSLLLGNLDSIHDCWLAISKLEFMIESMNEQMKELRVLYPDCATTGRPHEFWESPDFEQEMAAFEDEVSLKLVAIHEVFLDSRKRAQKQARLMAARERAEARYTVVPADPAIRQRQSALGRMRSITETASI